MDELDFADGELADDDPDVVEGMRRLCVLRSIEHLDPDNDGKPPPTR